MPNSRNKNYKMNNLNHKKLKTSLKNKKDLKRQDSKKRRRGESKMTTNGTPSKEKKTYSKS